MPARSWITLYPQWYASERERLAHRYPELQVDETALRKGALNLYGELTVHPPGGSRRFPIALLYPDATPYEKPLVVPLHAVPTFRQDGRVDLSTVRRNIMDYRHQMPDGALCLFQRETRADPSGDIVSGIDTLRRAERWFLGTVTGHWPPDSAESELEAHFRWGNDLLISESFYDSALEGGHGRFFYVRDYRRIVDTPPNAPIECPMIMTALTVDSGLIAQTIDARGDLERVYPWIRHEAWNVTNIVQAPLSGAGPLDALEQGVWWSLPAEPRPFTDGAGLLRELAAAVGDDPWEVLWSTLAEAYNAIEFPVIGFRYPGRSGEPEWLMVTVRFGTQRHAGGVLIESVPDKRQRFAAAPVYGIRVHSIRPNVLRRRNTGVVDAGVTTKTVALIGLGALGSTVAELLAKAGVGKFRLCDSDRLATGNVARHVGGINEFGAAKVRVVASRLLEINPYLSFDDSDLLPGSATQSLDALSAFIAPADLVIATTADESVESLINHLAVLAGKPVLFGRALRRGSVGRVFLVRPGRDACKACLASFAEAGRKGREVPPGWIDVPEGADDICSTNARDPLYRRVRSISVSWLRSRRG